MPRPLKSERLSVRLGPERAAKLEFAVVESGGRFRTYNQLLTAMVDEWLDRHTYTPGTTELTVKLPERYMDRLHALREDGWGDFDELVSRGIDLYAEFPYQREREFHELRTETNLHRQARRPGARGLETTGGV